MNGKTLELAWHKACAADRVTEGEGFGIKIGETRIGIYRLDDGSVHAMAYTISFSTHKALSSRAGVDMANPREF